MIIPLQCMCMFKITSRHQTSVLSHLGVFLNAISKVWAPAHPQKGSNKYQCNISVTILASQIHPRSCNFKLRWNQFFCLLFLANKSFLKGLKVMNGPYMSYLCQRHCLLISTDTHSLNLIPVTHLQISAQEVHIYHFYSFKRSCHSFRSLHTNVFPD